MHAFEALVGRYYSPLLRYIQRFLNDDEQAYDVLQFVFLQLYTSLATLRTNVSPKGWLFQVALSPKSRSIVHLGCSRELSFSEIGRMLEMPVPTVKAYFYRSLPQLRKSFTVQEHIA